MPYAFGSAICFSKISLERVTHTEVQGGVLPAQVVYPALARRLVRAVELHTPVEAEDYEYDDAETLAPFGAEIVSWTYPEPVENEFVFCIPDANPKHQELFQMVLF